MAKICLDLDEKLLEDLKMQAIKKKSNLEDLIREYAYNGLVDKGVDNMQSVDIPDEIMDKINIRCRELCCNPEKLIHSILFDYLLKVERIPSTIDCEKIMSLLEHDNPNGDDVLDNLVRLGKEGWD